MNNKVKTTDEIYREYNGKCHTFEDLILKTKSDCSNINKWVQVLMNSKGFDLVKYIKSKIDWKE